MSPHDSTDTRVADWDAASPHEAAEWFASVSAPWWIAGGWAIDLFLDRETRSHKDFLMDLVEVPAELAGVLRVLGCRYDGDEMRPLVAAVSAKGDPSDWVGLADWVVLVDFADMRLVSGDPLSVECRSIIGHE